VQDGGTRNDIFTFTVATTGPGPITIGNIQYSVGRGTGQANLTGPTTRLNSTTTGPVRQFIFFTNVSTGVTTLTKLNTAQFGLVNPDSNAWVTTITMTGPPKQFAVTSGGTATTTKTISGITITEKVADAFGVALTPGNTFCIDLASPAGVAFGASPSLSVTGAGISTDLVQSILTTGVGPLGSANSRITITIANAPAPGTLSSLTLNNVQLVIPAASVGTVRAILTDCADQAGPGGSLNGQLATADADGGALASTTDPAPPAVNTTTTSTNTFTGIGNFSGPNDSVNDVNRVVLFFLLLADRSGGNDRVATARILQQEKYGLAGVNSTTLGTGGCTGTPALPSATQQCGGTRFALVATADNFPDALSASYAAGRIGAAILLVRPTVDALAQVQLALQNLGVVTVLVLGGPAAVPDTVVDFLKGLPTSCTTTSACGGFPNTFTNGDPRQVPGTKLTVARIQDPINDTRYGTMRLLNILTGLPVSIPAVVQQPTPALFNATKQVAPVSPANVCTTCRTAFVVSGANFPDALSAGVRAYAQGIPMILTDPAALSPEASQTLKDLQTQQVVIVGGEAAVSAAVADSLTKATQDGGLGLVVARVSGADRISTAVAVMQYSTRNPTNTSLPGLGITTLNTVLLARSDTFPDSLTAAVQGIGSLFGVQTINGGFGLGNDPNKLNYAGNAAILLAVNPTTLGAATASQLTTVGGGTNGLSGAVNAIKCIGLQAAISDATCTAAQSALAGITT
jgi:putative cell wall-binding protein